MSTITLVEPIWLEEVKGSYKEDLYFTTKIQQLKQNPHSLTNCSYNGGILRYKGRVCIGSGGEIRQKVLQEIHASALGGHSGFKASYSRARHSFYWPRMREDVLKLVEGCEVCQRCKHENILYPGLLQPLPIPKEA